MTYDLTATPGAPTKRGKGLLISGAVLLVLGILAVIVGVAAVGNTAKELADTQVGASQNAPTTITGPLDAATTYAVYEAAESGKGTVQVADVIVTNSAGDPATVTASTDSASVTGKDGKNYVEVATFTVGTSDTFAVEVGTQGAVVAVAPSVSSLSKGFALGTAAILGIVLGVVGVILLIVGAVQRSRS